MAKSRISEAEALEALRREQDPGGGRFVDMAIDIVFQGQVVASVGGMWDRRLEDFDGEAETSIEIEPHEGEMEAIWWWMQWLAVHAGRRDDPPAPESDDELGNARVDPAEVYSALLAGGRRGGKTWSGALFCAMYAVMFADAIVWAINPSDSDHDEVRRYMSRFLAPEWIQREAADGWELINGSAIMLKSAYVGADPDAIKKGEVNLAWMNEGQKMAHRVYVVARGAIADHSGIVLVCANPPVQKKDQQWVGDFAADAQAGRRASVYHHFHPLKNPHINRAALLSMRRELDERAFRIEVLGEFLGAEDAVAYNWLRTAGGNERTMPAPDDPDWVDVTEEFLRNEEEGEGLESVIGMDFQIFPHMGGPVLKFFAPRDEEVTRDNVVIWGVDEVVIEGDELAWCAEATSEEHQIDPDTTLIVGDATGEYQHSRRRTSDSPPPEWKGKGSYDILRMGGFRHIVPPARRMRKKNPDVIDRVRSFTSMIEVYATRKRRLFLDPDRCPKTCKSVREWPTVHGKPSRIHEAAHLGDAISYPIIRIFPRILRSGKPGGVDPVTKRVDLPPARPAGFGPPPGPKSRRDRSRGL